MLLHFLGTSRTSGRTAQLIQGVQRLVRTAEEACDTILIDTGGYVQGPGGRDYKCALLGALAPCTAVFLGEDPVLDPLRHWVAARADIESLDVARPAAARRRGRGERRRERAAMHEAWLAAGQHRIVPLHEGLVLGPGCGIGRSVDARTRAALAASMCVVTGWRHGRPALDVTGRLLRTPGSVWTLGEQPG
jgi:polynucleotide 5'-kinase involved in rRNA processing